MRRIYSVIALLSLLAYLGLVFYTNRDVFTEKFDWNYWRERFDQSQWRFPLSQRIVGDSGLYMYEGYRLINGGDPSESNAEAPPLGKYLIGAVTSITGNAEIYGYITTLSTVSMFFILSILLFKSFPMAVSLTLLFATDPLITSQYTAVMLDSLQLLFLLLFFFFLLLTKKNTWVLMGTGICLGFYSQTKLPILTPFLFALGLINFWKLGYLNKIPFFILATIVGYILPYIPYFMMHHSFFDWVKLQKWVISFYGQSQLKANIGSVLTTLLANHYQDLFSRNFVTSSQWSLTWPLTIILGIIGMMIVVRKKIDWQTEKISPLIFFIVSSIGVYLFLPFWTRYLIIIIPFLYMISIYFLHKISNHLAIAVICIFTFINLSNSFSLIFPTPESNFRQFSYDWEHGFFSDMYEKLPDNEKKLIPREEFHRLGQQYIYDAQIESINVTVDPSFPWKRFISPQYIRLNVKYTTRNLGTFSENPTIKVISENGTWKIPWNWTFFIKGLSNSNHLETKVIPARRGSIINSRNKPLAAEFPSYLVSIIPKSVNYAHENDMLIFLQNIFDGKIKGVGIHQKYAANTQPDFAVPIGVIPKTLSSEELTELKQYPGIKLTPQMGRKDIGNNNDVTGQVMNTLFAECCSLLYNATSYSGTNGLEKKYDAILKGENGGTLTINDDHDSVTRIILNNVMRDGQDVTTDDTIENN
jgi:hypothetical protein